MKKGMAQITPEVEGWERAAFLVVVPSIAGERAYLCYAIGESEGHVFFDLVNDSRVELHGKSPVLLIHYPTKGTTFELNGSTRPLRKVEPLVVVN